MGTGGSRRGVPEMGVEGLTARAMVVLPVGVVRRLGLVGSGCAEEEAWQGKPAAATTLHL